LTGRSSFWACCAAPPPPKPKKEKKATKEKKAKKEKKTKKESKSDDRHNLPVGFQCNGGDEMNPVGTRDEGVVEADENGYRRQGEQSMKYL